MEKLTKHLVEFEGYYGLTAAMHWQLVQMAIGVEEGTISEAYWWGALKRYAKAAQSRIARH